MRVSRSTRGPAAGATFNAVPMVDVIFLLTIFFMLVSRFSSEEQVPMKLPNPEQSQAKVAKLPDRVVINCRMDASSDSRWHDVLYSIGPNRPEPLETIGDRLDAMKREVPELKVVVRADRRLHYEDVRALMRVIARHGVEMLNVVAHVAEEE